MSYRPEKLGKYVYFLRRKDGIGPIKVGCSRLPLVRLREFYRWSPYELELLASTPGTHEDERALHRRFAAHRSHMEWFAPAPELLAAIERVAGGATLAEAFALKAAQPLARAA